MIAVKVLEVKTFMAALLLHDVFDNFLVSDIEILTANLFKINGRLNKNFFDDTQKEEIGDREYTYWKDIKNLVYQMIKGSKTPQAMKFVFLLSKENMDKILLKAGSEFKPDEVEGLFLNIRYEKEELGITTGTSIKTFTMNKSLDQEWDASVKKFLKYHGILTEE